MKKESFIGVWDLLNQGFKWLSGFVTLFSPVKSVINDGTRHSNVRRLLGNLCLTSI